MNSHTANVVVAQLLHLAFENPDEDIKLYISPGGSVYDGLAIMTRLNLSNQTYKQLGLVSGEASMGHFAGGWNKR